MSIGLVLEGGAMRGLYTAGVLDVFLDNNIKVDGIIGVSAGVLFGVNYLSKQKGRGIRYNKKFTERNQIIKNSMYNMVTVNGPGFQIMKNQNIQNTVNPDYQAVTVFG